MITLSTSNLEDFFKQGHIWAAPVWNPTERRVQARPIVIVGNDFSNDSQDLIVNYFTKQGARNKFDVEIKKWAEVGLQVESWARTSKPFVITRRQVKIELVERNGLMVPKGFIGKLEEEDLASLINQCKQLF